MLSPFTIHGERKKGKALEWTYKSDQRPQLFCVKFKWYAFVRHRTLQGQSVLCQTNVSICRGTNDLKAGQRQQTVGVSAGRNEYPRLVSPNYYSDLIVTNTFYLSNYHAFSRFCNIIYWTRIEEINGPAVSALGLRLRKLSNVLNGQS
jgi:hypothetical protein